MVQSRKKCRIHVDDYRLGRTRGIDHLLNGHSSSDSADLLELYEEPNQLIMCFVQDTNQLTDL